VRLVFAWSALTVGRVGRRERQKSPALYLADSYVSVREEGMELLHEILANEVRKVDLVERVAKHGQKDLLNTKS